MILKLIFFRSTTENDPLLLLWFPETPVSIFVVGVDCTVCSTAPPKSKIGLFGYLLLENFMILLYIPVSKSHTYCTAEMSDALD